MKKATLQEELLSEAGLCRASIRAETDLQAIQLDLAAKEAEFNRIFRWIDAIKDPTRFKLVYLLSRHGDLCVCDLANILGVSSSAISQHLRKLKDMELVSATRRKQTIFHALKCAEFAVFFRALLDPAEAEQQPGYGEGVGELVAGAGW